MDNLIRMLKLTNAQDTILGDNLIRGVSGGERKRVTIAEMIMGFSRVLVLGEWVPPPPPPLPSNAWGAGGVTERDLCAVGTLPVGCCLALAEAHSNACLPAMLLPYLSHCARRCLLCVRALVTGR